jgi:hypothetical protein
LAEVAATGTCRPYEKEFFRKDGSRVPVLMAGANFDELRHQGVAFALDLTERKRAEAELAHVNRVATMGELMPPLTAACCSVQIGRTGSRSRRDFQPRFDSVGAIVQTETAWGVPAAGEPCVLFLPANTAHQFVGSCWYRQQSRMKINVSSNRYGIRRLSARGTIPPSALIAGVHIRQ